MRRGADRVEQPGMHAAESAKIRLTWTASGLDFGASPQTTSENETEIYGPCDNSPRGDSLRAGV